MVRFHRGFLDALAMVWEPLFSAVDQAQKAKERPLWITGHSLGGAIALLAAWRFRRNFLAVQEIVTFGGPMIGNDTAARAFEQEFAGKIYRYVDLEDVVPHLPSVSLLANAYQHCLAEVALARPKLLPLLPLLRVSRHLPRRRKFPLPDSTVACLIRFGGWSNPGLPRT